MITKAEVRSVSLGLLSIAPGDCVWDVGAGCGSVGLEAASLVRHGFVYAVERDEQQIEMLRENLQRFPAPLRIVSGLAPASLASLPAPNAVFVGGSGGNLSDILSTVQERLLPGGRLVANFVVLEHVLTARCLLDASGWTTRLMQISVSRDAAPGRLEALNPVFVIAAQRPDHQHEPQELEEGQPE